MVATTQLRLAPETEDERRARVEYLSDKQLIPDINCSILRGVIINKLTRTIHFFRTIHNYIMHVCTVYVYKYNLICIYCVR